MPFDANGNWVDAPTQIDPWGSQQTPGGIDFSQFGDTVLSGGGFGEVNTGTGDAGLFGGAVIGTFPTSGWGQIGQGFSDIWGALTSGGRNSPLGMGLSAAPGLLALNYAGQQPGFDPSNLQGILGQLGGNQDAIVKAATDPFQQNIAAGYG